MACPQKEHTYLVLDALRGLAAISVTIYHFMGYLTAYQQHGLPNADLAVDFFFILSGFVIAFAYEKRILAGQTSGRFMMRRLIRLYPMYFLGITLPIVLLMIKMYFLHQTDDLPAQPISYLFELFFLPTPPALLPGDSVDLKMANIFPLNHPSWSLSLEVGINLVFVLLCRYMVKTPRLLAFIALSGVAFCVATFAYGSIDLGWNWPGYIGGWARAAWAFFAGFLLYRFHSTQKQNKLPAWTGVALGVFLIAIFLFPADKTWYQLPNCLLVMPLMVWVGARSEVWKPAHTIYAWLGRTSYAVYIIHMPILPIIMMGMKHLNLEPHDHVALTVTISTVLSIITAGILDVVYDLPLRAWLTHKLLPAEKKSA